MPGLLGEEFDSDPLDYLSRVPGLLGAQERIPGIHNPNPLGLLGMYRDTGGMLPRKVITPEQLPLGSIVTPMVGDRSITGKALTGMHGVPFEREVPIGGGPMFMRGPQQKADQAAWASHKGVVSTLSKRIQHLAKKGDVYGVYSPMSKEATDFADFSAKAVMQQMKTARVAKKDKRAFDVAMKTDWIKKKDGYEYPAARDWPGIDKVTDEWIDRNPGARKKLMKLMDLAQYRDMGFPNIKATRQALTEPELRDIPSGHAGFAISKMDPAGRIIENPSVPHSTYNTQLAGQYVGGFEKPVPRAVMFPDWMKTLKPATQKNLSQQDRAFGMQTVSQEVTRQWVDQMMRYLTGG